MGEKKIKRADGTEVTAKTAKAVGNATGYRVGAIVAWVFAIAFEVLAVLALFGVIGITFMSTLTFIIVLLVLDLACVIVGSLLWKKANHINPASKKNKVKFWLWNNLGLIVCAFAFVPFVVLALTNKEADKKTKTVAAVVAVVALLIGSLFGFEWNPVSEEEKDSQIAALEEADIDDVYWTKFGKVYHTSTECGHLNHSDELTVGSVEEAIAAGKTRLCKTCQARDNIVIAENADAEKGGIDLPVESGENTDTDLPVDTGDEDKAA